MSQQENTVVCMVKPQWNYLLGNNRASYPTKFLTCYTTKRWRNETKYCNLNSDVYLTEFNRLEESIKRKCTYKKNKIMFHFDNSRSHIDHRVIQSINDKRRELLEHQPYSSTESPIKYHVNGSLEQSIQWFE